MTLLVAWLKVAPRLTRALRKERVVGANADMAEAPKIAATTAVVEAFMIAVAASRRCVVTVTVFSVERQ